MEFFFFFCEELISLLISETICLITSNSLRQAIDSIYIKKKKGYLVRWVKITLIFANLTHRLKSKIIIIIIIIIID